MERYCLSRVLDWTDEWRDGHGSGCAVVVVAAGGVGKGGCTSRSGERGGTVGSTGEGSGVISAEGEEREVARMRIDGAGDPLRCVYVGDKG